eukprot:scaffold100541_cov18-Prasinocladus_malaysianus.AAC.1
MVRWGNGLSLSLEARATEYLGTGMSIDGKYEKVQEHLRDSWIVVVVLDRNPIYQSIMRISQC